VIRIESVHIEEMRGIRKLDLTLEGKTFAISGPNGSGKSGVIDAIEFGLTGQIGRLTGRGTQGLSLAEHGPHVDKTKFPDAAFVTLTVFLPELNKTATITRKVSSPKKPQIAPADEDVLAVLSEIASHPEITLSRREILRFILIEPTKRSEEIQTLLKLEDIGRTRALLNTTQNRLQSAHKTAVAQVELARNSLTLHLQIPTLKTAELLDAVNMRRTLLGLAALPDLASDTKLDTGLAVSIKSSSFNKESMLADLEAFGNAVKELPADGAGPASAIRDDLEKLESDPELVAALQRRSFVERGLDFVEGAECPLCDTSWESENALREHLQGKLVKSEEARKLQEVLLENGMALAGITARLIGLIAPIRAYSEVQKESTFASELSGWKAGLEDLSAKLQTVEGIRERRARFDSDWATVPANISHGLAELTAKVQAQPDQTATLNAQTFLTTAQTRLSDYREAMRKSRAAEIAMESAKQTYAIYCDVLETELNALYGDVQNDFSEFYRAINGDDESTFTAKLTPSAGSLGLDVNFYERGLFPPAAYHSEGHQDGMGVCLYLALMKRLFGVNFNLALLDDVVMSVDTAHRYEFCKLLKTSFPGTQFVITTHDRLWAEQMRSAGLVTSKTSVAFHSWTIDSGPLVESNVAIWDEIEGALSKGKVEAAAAALRHHLEYVSRHMADQLGASPQFRGDGSYELGDLLPSVLKRMKDLLGKAADAAQSWGNDAAKQDAAARKALLSASAGATNVEQWAVNKAVHYNGWTNFGKKDFEPVAAAFKELLGMFSCTACDSWLFVSPRGNPDSMRCPCGGVTLNLKVKHK
jgi:recombinational DNA repair ATPase RecF